MGFEVAWWIYLSGCEYTYTSICHSDCKSSATCQDRYELPKWLYSWQVLTRFPRGSSACIHVCTYNIGIHTTRVHVHTHTHTHTYTPAYTCTPTCTPTYTHTYTHRSGRLVGGEWAVDGCYRNNNLSNTTVTVCQCNHLTHFAILLSPGPVVSSCHTLVMM